MHCILKDMWIERRLRGTGSFVLSGGSHLPCTSFRIDQSGSGRTFLYSERNAPLLFSAHLGQLAAFQGQTAGGQAVRTNGSLDEYIDTGKELCLILRNVEVGQTMGGVHSHRLSLTNVTFPLDNPRPITLTVRWGGNTIPVKLSPLRSYRSRIEHLVKTRGIVSTSLLAFHDANFRGSPVNEFISDLCLAISLVQGRKLNWTYHATYGPRRSFQHAIFGATITKPYPSPPLCFAPNTRSAVTSDLTAAEEAVPAIEHFRENFDPHNRLINSWLDARTETDYLEGRTLKYVVVIETLNALTMQVDKTIATTVQDPSVWKAVYRAVVAARPTLEGSVSLQNWQRLNERPFRETLSAVCGRHKISLPPSDVTLFSQIRNNIVHRLNYDLKITLPNRWSMPNSPQVAQHFFVGQFVDRVVLELFGLRSHIYSVSGQ